MAEHNFDGVPSLYEIQPILDGIEKVFVHTRKNMTPHIRGRTYALTDPDGESESTNLMEFNLSKNANAEGICQDLRWLHGRYGIVWVSIETKEV